MKKLCACLLVASLALATIDDATAQTKKIRNHKKRPVVQQVVEHKDTVAAEPAKSPVSGTFTLTSNYLFRGVSQSNRLPAAQGGLTYTFHSTGVYLSLWGSNVNQTAPDSRTATVEFDYIAGIANSIGNFNYDVNISRYNYPKTSGLNYNELIANGRYYFLTGILAYSNNVFNSGASGTYYNLGIKYDVPPKYAFNFNNVTVGGGMGHYDLPKNKGLNSYSDRSIFICKVIGIYTLTALWSGTDGRYKSPPLDDDAVVASVGVNF